MNFYRIIVPGQADMLIQADDFTHQPDSGRVVFGKEDKIVAIFQLNNIVGIVQVDEYGDQ